MSFLEVAVTRLDPDRARTCVGCGVPMVPRRAATTVPDGYRPHEARGYCSTCYVAPSADETYEPVMWQGLPEGDLPLGVFHRYAPPPPWTVDALCAQTDPEVFFPEKGGSTRAPKAVCAACPTRAACLDYALDNREKHGIWGGTTATERKAILRGRGAS